MIYMIAIAAVIIAPAIFIATRPDTFRVERAKTIDAPVATVFGLVNDFRQWTAWSPWEGLDPNLQRTYSDPSAGKGAAYSWSGNNKAGKGSMEITDSVRDTRIAIDLRFEKPFKAQNVTEFHFAPAGSGTRITWVMHGKNTAMGKAMAIVGGMEGYLGKEFEAGLAKLEAAARAGR